MLVLVLNFAMFPRYTHTSDLFVEQFFMIYTQDTRCCLSHRSHPDLRHSLCCINESILTGRGESIGAGGKGGKEECRSGEFHLIIWCVR